ncbi:PadR family transcriptional regulator [Proteinivorax tanatarense]|uniref:PadR family transcriptional regulator n=1 Tax=Proteinivorax tanatarense TaxID=1260629 RepID=A0AAU7VJP4_9FIRM
MITQFKKGALKLCVLSLLNKKDCYGYEIVEIISRCIEVSEGTIYPLLRRLTKEGVCETYLKQSTEGPTRKYYRITKEGTSHYLELKKQWYDFQGNVNYILEIEIKGVETNEKE